MRLYHAQTRLFCVDRVGLAKQEEVLWVQGHEKGAVHVEVPEARGETLEPAPPDENHHLALVMSTTMIE